MRFLLINKNIAVSKLVNASIKHMGYQLFEFSSYDEIPLGNYAAIFIDSAMYKKEYMEDLLFLSTVSSLILFKERDKVAQAEFLYVLEKPFLPTDFINFMIDLIKKTPELNEHEIKSLEEYLSVDSIFAQSNQYYLHEKISEAKEPQKSPKKSIFDIVLNNNLNREIKTIEELNEKDIINALDEFYVEKPISTELVKGEIESAISKSIINSLQSRILRDALKGLKMNITITFEDN